MSNKLKIIQGNRLHMKMHLATLMDAQQQCVKTACIQLR